MGHVLRPLFQCLPWRHRQSPFCHLHSLHSSSLFVSSNLHFISFFSISCRAVHLRPRGSKVREVSSPYGADDSDDVASIDNSEIVKSRNMRKREARRAVRWGMELASFSPPQIKRIVRAAALEQEVFDALMLVKRLGRDVREGKRRQFNYIGGLLREVEPELMDGLIQAIKDGDLNKFQNLSGIDRLDIDAEKEEDKEIEEKDEEENFRNIALVNRWCDGLINKDTSVTNEIYSLRDVEFDRQIFQENSNKFLSAFDWSLETRVLEGKMLKLPKFQCHFAELRQLVRKVHSTLESQASSEENGQPDAAVHARRSLSHFLQGLAKQLPSE